MMDHALSWRSFLRLHATPIVLSLVLVIIVLVAAIAQNSSLDRTIIDLLIRVVFVVGLYIFIGNSGVVSFGHTAFMMIGAYATAWQDCCSMVKSFFMPALPKLMLETTVPPPIATVTSGLFAALVGLLAGAAIMRLSGIGASIATFAMLVVVDVVYSNWESLTSGTSTMTGIPPFTDHWIALVAAVAAIFVAYLYKISRFGLMLRTSREDEVAAKASGVNVVLQRLIAFVLSAFFAGLAGGLYAHFLGTITVAAFYLDLTFITLAMLVIGGMNSLSGAVIGVISISALIEVLRQLERGVDIGLTTIAVPGGTQEIGLGVAMVLILIFRQRGITGNQEITWPFSRLMDKPGKARAAFLARTLAQLVGSRRSSPSSAVGRRRRVSSVTKQGEVP
jgi:branched-chain amino acid transport system permease protein